MNNDKLNEMVSMHELEEALDYLLSVEIGTEDENDALEEKAHQIIRTFAAQITPHTLSNLAAVFHQLRNSEKYKETGLTISAKESMLYGFDPNAFWGRTGKEC